MIRKFIFISVSVIFYLFNYQTVLAGEEVICWHGKGQDRISACSKIINSNVAVPDAISKAHRNRAREFASIGQYKKAVHDLSIAISRNPERIDLLIERGKIYIAWGRVELANSDFKKAIEINPALQEQIDQILIPTN